MLTPQEVQEKTFEKAVFGGYDMGAVDDFLEPLTEDYIGLYKENAVLKNKMKVLVDSIEEYRKTEEAIRTVLIGAQKTADDIVEKAKAEAEAIKRNAEAAAVDKTRGLAAEYGAWEEKLQTAKKNTISYLEKMKKVYTQQLEFVDGLANLDIHKAVEAKLEEPAPAPEAPAEAEEETAKAIGDSVQKIIEQETAARAAQETAKVEKAAGKPRDEEEESTSPKPKFEFVDLQFGKDYELK